MGEGWTTFEGSENQAQRKREKTGKLKKPEESDTIMVRLLLNLWLWKSSCLVMKVGRLSNKVSFQWGSDYWGFDAYTCTYCKPRNISKLLNLRDWHNLAKLLIFIEWEVKGQIPLLAILAAIMSIVRWLKNKESSLLPVGDASISAANKEIEMADAQHHKKRGTYHHYNEIRAKIATY